MVSLRFVVAVLILAVIVDAKAKPKTSTKATQTQAKKKGKDVATQTDDGASEPSGRYCGSVSILVASEYVELWIHAHSKTFDFRARGIATVPWCPGNHYAETIKGNGDRIGIPTMEEPKKCLQHELRHLGKEAQKKPPIEVRWTKATDTVKVLVKNVPLVKTITLDLSKDQCEEFVSNVGHDDEL